MLTVLKYIAAVLMVCLTSACARLTAPEAGSAFAIPPARVVALEFHGTDLEFSCVVTNRTETPIRISSHVWELRSEGRRLARGQGRQVRVIPPAGHYEFKFPISLKQSALEKVLGRHPLPLEIPYEFTLRLQIVRGIAAVEPVRVCQGVMPVLARPRFDLSKFHIVRQNGAAVNIAAELTVHNPNMFPTELRNFEANFILASQTIAQGVELASKTIPARQSVTVARHLNINLDRLGSSVAGVLSSSKAEYIVYGETDFATPWGNRRIAYDHSGTIDITR